MGHPIADAYQSMLAERVEVVRGPASVLYGSNAMGGVINIVTRKQREEGIRTDLQAAYGSYNTLQTELSNRIRKGTLHERRHRLLQPHRRPPRRHGLRTVRRLRQAGIRAFESMDAVGRREPDALQRIESGRGDGAAHRQRLAHHTRTGLRRPGQPLRPHVGRPEPLLQLGGGTRSTTAMPRAANRSTTGSTRATGCWGCHGTRVRSSSRATG